VQREARSGIRIGVGGWVYEPWRGAFYPAGLAHKRELEHASRQLTSIEINGTYYGSQKPESFARWHSETPPDFVFAVKGPRFAVNRRVLAEAGKSVERFLAGGVLELKEKLGPINWQFLPTKRFDAEDFERFLKLLPASAEGRRIRHAVEVRHDSFRSPDFVALARDHGVAIVLAADSEYPQIADITAPFAYVRLMGTSEAEPAGYPEATLASWAGHARRLAAGRVPEGLSTLAPRPADKGPRDVFLYVINGFKERNPAAARAILARL
jgi:uncharacterized protein YecE (DUF72 family)